MAESGGQSGKNASGGEQEERSLKAERPVPEPEPTSRRKGGVALLAGLVLVTVLAGGVYLLGKTYFTGTTSETAQQGEARIGGPFTLTDQDGETVTEETYAGKFKLVFFGYTFCPDVCPTTLTDISNVMQELGAKSDQVVPLFVSVDPQRDTPAHLKEYVGFFDQRIQALTGTPEQIKDVAEAYKVYYKKAQQNPDDPGDYLMDHSSVVYLMGPEGRFRTHFSHGTRVETMVDAITKEIEKGA